MKRFLFSALLASCLVPFAAEAATCDATLQAHFAWLKAPHPSTNRSLGFTATSLNSVSTSTYFEAELSDFRPAGCGGAPLFACAGDRVSTRDPVLVYGNWSCVLAPSSGGFASCANPFNKGLDKYRVNLSMPYGGGAGSLRFTAQTSGVSTQTIPLENLSCSNGIMSGTSTGAAPTTYLIDLSRIETGIPE